MVGEICSPVGRYVTALPGHFQTAGIVPDLKNELLLNPLGLFD